MFLIPVFMVFAIVLVLAVTVQRDPNAPAKKKAGPNSIGSLLSGLVIVTVGTVLLLDQFGYLDARVLWHFWPVIFIIAGIAKLTSSNYANPRIWGGFLILFGVILTLHEFGRFPVGIGHLWPLFIIVAGLLLMWQAYEAKHDANIATGDDAAHIFSIFGGSEQHLNTQNFRGGQLFALFGGYQLDLTRAEIGGETAVLDATSLFGGGEIVIPRHWNVIMKGIGIFGGYGDETGKIPPDGTKAPKTLVVKGVAMFGGVAVKN